MKSQFRFSISAILMIALLAVAGCGGGKKTASSSPYSTAPEVTAPTAHISANPTAISPGDSVELSWRSTDATSVHIDGIGDVPSSGKRTVAPNESTSYRLVVRGDGGTAEDTVRVTVNLGHEGEGEGTDRNLPPISEAEAQLFRSTMQDVFYGYDSYKPDDEAQAILAKDAAFLAKYPKFHIVIGGYCDERGSSEYNLALGQNRAEAARKALVAAGISDNRIRIVSYGKEKPFCKESTEECWAKNRRAGFTLDK